MKLLVLTMFGQLLQQNMRVKRDFMAGGPVHVLIIELAICSKWGGISLLHPVWFTGYQEVQNSEVQYLCVYVDGHAVPCCLFGQGLLVKQILMSM